MVTLRSANFAPWGTIYFDFQIQRSENKAFPSVCKYEDELLPYIFPYFFHWNCWPNLPQSIFIIWWVMITSNWLVDSKLHSWNIIRGIDPIEFRMSKWEQFSCSLLVGPAPPVLCYTTGLWFWRGARYYGG